MQTSQVTSPIEEQGLHTFCRRQNANESGHKIYTTVNLSLILPVYTYETGFKNTRKGGEDMESFESNLAKVKPIVERYVRFRLQDSPDAEDVTQDIFLLSFLRYGQLRDKNAFKPWILAIAKRRCADYFRSRGKNQEIPIDDVPEIVLSYGRQGIAVHSAVEDTMDTLMDKDREILQLFFWSEFSQQEIAEKLNIPVGTVKSRLYTAKQHFKQRYPFPPKGENTMLNLPKIMPQYTIERLESEPFACRWEELQGWLLVPRPGEKLTWGMYDAASGKRTEYTQMEVTGKAEVHGIEGVEVVAVQYDSADYYRTGSADKLVRRFVAQLTDTHCRYLAESHYENGVRKIFTFLDGEDFMNNWGFGPDNCGNEVNIAPKGFLKREGNSVTGHTDKEVVDIVGRYAVTIGGKTYDTVCVMDIQCFNDGVASEQYLDKNGRTVLWRRFNRDDWAIEHFGGNPWSQQLPDNERLLINGETYVHWYDCMSDYVK